MLTINHLNHFGGGETKNHCRFKSRLGLGADVMFSTTFSVILQKCNIAKGLKRQTGHEWCLSRPRQCCGTGRTWTRRCEYGGWPPRGSCWCPPFWSLDTAASGAHAGSCWSPPPEQEEIEGRGEGQPGMSDGVEAGVSPRRWPTPRWTVGHRRRGCHVSPWRRSCRLLVLSESQLPPRSCPHHRWCHPDTKRQKNFLNLHLQKKNDWWASSKKSDEIQMDLER